LLYGRLNLLDLSGWLCNFHFVNPMLEWITVTKISTSLATELKGVEIPRIGATSREGCPSNSVIMKCTPFEIVLYEGRKKTTENSGDFAPMLKNGFPRPTLLLQDEQRIA
jgi:hypothetical protein